jgi:uncharacterized repeat protein (TIGR01451 family)
VSSLLLGALAIGLAWTLLASGAANAFDISHSSGLDPTDPIASGRLVQNGVASTCAAAKANPGTVTAPLRWEAFEIAGAPGACVTVVASASDGSVVVGAYSSFDPANPGANYLGDAGSAVAPGTPRTFSFLLPASGRAVIVTEDLSPSAAVIHFAYEITGATTATDISVSKTDNVDPVVAGTNLTYTITVTNNGPENFANGVTLSDPLPAGTTFVSETHPGFGWTCTPPPVGSGGTYSCSGAMFNVGIADTFTVTVHIDPDATPVLTNTASVSRFGDYNAANNNATENTMVVRSADLTIAKSDAPDPVTAGNNITYTITVGNAGPSAAANATLSDTLPGGTTLASFVSPSGWICPTVPPVGAGGTVQCNRASLAPADGPQVFTLIVKVNSNVAAGATITNVATLTSPTSDPSTPNTATANTTVNVDADLGIQKSCPVGPVLPGDNLTCTLTVTNNGPSDAQSVVVSDDLPTGVTLVGTPSGGGFTCGTGDPFTCTRATVPANAGPQVITVNLRVDDDVPGGTALVNAATVSSATADNSSSNNSTTSTTLLPACTIDRTNATSGQVIRGTNGPDVICGSAFADSIQGLDGDDIIFGNGGNDSIQGNGGNDKLFGGAGDDAITGPPGIDAANGGSGYDRCMSRTNTNCEQAQVA